MGTRKKNYLGEADSVDEFIAMSQTKKSSFHLSYFLTSFNHLWSP